MLTVLGIRHGEVHNPGGVIYSSLPDFFLSATGLAEAADIAEAVRHLDVRAIYASPLDRAQQTAAALAERTGLSVVTDERLVEWKHWERWAGSTWSELAATAPEDLDRYLNDPGAVTSGESLVQLAERMAAWLGDVVAAHDDGVVIGVSHLEPLRAILIKLLGLPPGDLFSMEIGHCGVVRLHPHPSADALDPRQM